MAEKDVVCNRLRNILIKDKQQNPRKVLMLISADVRNLMQSYVEFGGASGVYSDVKITPNGLEFDIRVICKRMKEINVG